MSVGITTSMTPMKEFDSVSGGASSTATADYGLDDLERRCTQALLTILPQLRQFINRDRDGDAFSITVQQYTVLKALAEQRRLISELADMLKVSRPTMSRIIDGLEGRRRSGSSSDSLQRRPKLVERRACQDDHRLVYAHITDEGMLTLQQYHAQAEENLTSVLRRLEPVELATLLRTLENLEQALDQG
jgi:DNA-binding MarR family transcriptional regulator